MSLVEDMFNSISNSFAEISTKIENLNLIIEKIVESVYNSMTQISDQIDNLTKTLENILNLSDFKKVKQDIQEMVEIFRIQLDPKKIQNLIVDITKSAQKLKQID